MENQNVEVQEMCKDYEKKRRRGKIVGGFLIVTIGSLFLAKELGAEIPTWIFTWKMLLIGLGIVLAIKHKFLHPGWIILVGVGATFLLNDIYPEMQIKPIVWPILIILAGLFIIFKPRRKPTHNWNKWNKHHYKQYWKQEHKPYDYNQSVFHDDERNKEDYIESTTIMAGVKKNVISKKFKGGEVTNVLGGTEINLMQADIEKSATIELAQVFGGTKLIIPANWEIKSDFVTVFGSLEDKRPAQIGLSTETPKILCLTGVTVFGGIEIRSY